MMGIDPIDILNCIAEGVIYTLLNEDDYADRTLSSPSCVVHHPQRIAYLVQFPHAITSLRTHDPPPR